MKQFLLSLLVMISVAAKAQKIDSIYVNLYTDSLKKGTFNYINIDGKLSNGRYIPLDSTHLIFTASAGKFYGNTLWIDGQFKEEKVLIRSSLRSDPNVYKEFWMYIKTIENNERLRTTEEILNSKRNKKG